MKKITTIILSITLSLTAFAQTDSLPHYLKVAAENNPGVKADFLAYQAALQKIPQAGALQDPQLDLGFFLQPMEIIDGKQVADIKLMQMFPWFGTRKAAQTEAQHMAKMAFEQFRETRDKLFLDVYTQWFTLCRLQQQLVNNQENKKLLIQLEALALRKFSTGNAAAAPSGERQKVQGESGGVASTTTLSGMNMGTALSPSASNPSPQMSGMSQGSMSDASSGMSDVLRIQLEMAEIENNTENLLSEIQAEKTKFNALLNYPAESDVQLPDSLKQIPFLFDISTAKTLITNQNPMLNMINEEELTYRAKAEMDKKMSYPMFGIGLQYMFINKKPVTAEMDPMRTMSGDMGDMNPPGNTGSMSSMNGKDMIMPMISVSIPLYRNKYKAQQRETAFLQQAAREKYTNTQNLLEAELYRTKHQLDDATRRISLYRKQTELAQTTYNLIIQEFATGKSDLANVIQVQRQLLDYELKTAEAIADYNTMVANLQKLIANYNTDNPQGLNINNPQ
ncbi:transporter [Bacteroidia bacterium]|nr:transporter [Bacteroidia bacterium]